MNFSFFYSSQECHVIHNKFPSNIGNDTVMIIVKFVVMTELIRSQNSMAVIFLMAELDSLLHFVILRRLLSERD